MRHNHRVCNLLFLILFVFGFSQIPGQEMVYTKDGLPIMERNDFINTCVESFSGELKEMDFPIDPNKFCSCMADDFIPSFNSWEFPDIDKMDFNNIFDEESDMRPLLECFFKSTSDDGNINIQPGEGKNWFSNLAKDSCVEAFLKDPEFNEIISHTQAEEYCECAVQKMLSGNYSLDDLDDLDNENSTAYNEVILECMEGFLISEGFGAHNIYDSNDIKGSGKYTDAKFISYPGQGNKVKIEINGVSHYYLIDTGASDLIIDRNLERTLLMNGTLKEENYLDREVYMTADNREIYGQNIWVDNVKIGNYTVNNVIIVVIDDGGFLLGMGFLNKFSKWEILKDKKVLRLYK